MWGVDNKGAMVRAVGGAGDPATRLENRSGEPAANPYLYIASQIVSGLDGLRRGARPGPARRTTRTPPRRPRCRSSLGEAVDALEADPRVRRRARRAGRGLVRPRSSATEFARYLAHVSDWEQREYFDLF